MYNPETKVSNLTIRQLKRQIIQWNVYFIVYKLFNVLHVAKINHEYQFVYHCVAILMGDNSLL